MRRLLTSLALLSCVLARPAAAAFLNKSAITGVDTVAYSNSISSAVTVIGSSITTIVVSSTMTLSANTTVPSNVTLKVVRGGYISNTASKTLTVNGAFEAGPYEIFTNFLSTNIVLNNCEFSYPEWFGAKADNSFDNVNAINAVVKLGLPTQFNRGTYLTSSSATLNTPVTISGRGKGKTIIKRSSAGSAIFVVASSSASIEDLTLDGNSLGGSVLISSESLGSHYYRIQLKNTGGTSYAWRFWASGSGNQFFRVEDIDFNGNYGNMWVESLTYGRIVGLQMHDNNGGYHIDCSSSNTFHQFTDTTIRDSYFRGGKGINMSGVSGIRKITFDGGYIRIDTFTEPWFRSAYTGAGGEVANIEFKGFTIDQKVDLVGTPIFDVGNYQHVFDNNRILNSAGSTNHSIFRDRGTNNLVWRNSVVESTNRWLFFSTDTTGGFNTVMENVNYTQGVPGTVVWYQPTVTDSITSNHIKVTHSNLNHTVGPKTGSNALGTGGWTFHHIHGSDGSGNLDLRLASGPVSVFDIVPGSVTDTNAVVIGTYSVCNSSTNIIGLSGTFQDVCQLYLLPGKWTIGGMGQFDFSSSSGTSAGIGISSVASPTSGLTSGRNRLTQQWNVSTHTVILQQMSLTPFGIEVSTHSLGVTTTYYLKVFSQFNTGNPTFLGSVKARRDD